MDMWLAAYWQFNASLNHGASDQEGVFDWGQVTGNT